LPHVARESESRSTGARSAEYLRSVRFGFALYAESELASAVKKLASALT